MIAYSAYRTRLSYYVNDRKGYSYFIFAASAFMTVEFFAACCAKSPGIAAH
jgi:hypothetical protein